jgi:ribosome-associated translation inhibitor RaiA
MKVEHIEKGGLSYTSDNLLLLARKVGKLATYCKKLKDEASYIRIESDRRDTKKASDHIKVAISVFLPKKTLHVESRKADPIDAVDSCIEKLEEQVKAYKEMNTGRAKAHIMARKKKGE